MYDVIIVGGGPAGLSAALLLGRCRRKVLLCDSGTPRNGASRHLHGYLSRDGIAPLELRAKGRAELARYGVELRDVMVTEARCHDGGFELRTAEGAIEHCRKLLLATGVSDHLPAIPGFAECYGQSVFHCPYCDGWEVRDTRLALYAPGRSGVGMALALRDWSADILLCTDGPSRLSVEDQERLGRHSIRVRGEKVVRLEHAAGRLRSVVFAAGTPEPVGSLFFRTGQSPQSDLARRLGCRFTRKGAVKTGRLEETGIPNLYVAGDASRDVQLAIVAAAEGVKAAFAINTAFQQERLEDPPGVPAAVVG